MRSFDLGSRLWLWEAAPAVWVAPMGRLAAASPPPDRLPWALGIAFHDSARMVRTILGPPERRESLLGFVAWDYDRRGMTVMWDCDAGVLRVIVLHKRAAGAVDGVRVGDTVEAAMRQWGKPLCIRPMGRYRDFVRRGFATSVEVQNGRIVEITLIVARKPSNHQVLRCCGTATLPPQPSGR
jgi:hypothetical protein